MSLLVHNSADVKYTAFTVLARSDYDLQGSYLYEVVDRACVSSEGTDSLSTSDINAE
jgi:hypothetical protein